MTDRNFSEIFAPKLDAGEPLDVTVELTPEDLIRYTVPSGGPFITGAPQSNTLTEGSDILLSPIATIAADTLLDPMTIADVALFTEVSAAVTELGLAAVPTSFHVTSVAGNQNGNGLRSNGVYRSNNAGPLNGTGFGNWTWRVKVTVIGDWISHQYFNDTGNLAFRDSFDGGASWSSWGN